MPVLTVCDRRDPHCEAYRRLFTHISDRALAEVFSDENLAAVVEHGANGRGLLQRGPLLQIMAGRPHPQKAAARARETIASVALAVSASPEEALQKLNQAGAITDPVRALQSLTALQRRLRTTPQGLVNAYIHVTYSCNLACDHCYAIAGPGHAGTSMAPSDVASLVGQTAGAGFTKAVITGGEPLAHPQRDALLDTLAELRSAVKPMQIILRTNLSGALPGQLLAQLVRAADQVIVSVDGDAACHDARRGRGAYAPHGHQPAPVGGTHTPDLRGRRPLPGSARRHADRGRGRRHGRRVPCVTWGRNWICRCASNQCCRWARAAGQGLAPESYSSLDDDLEGAGLCGRAPCDVRPGHEPLHRAGWRLLSLLRADRAAARN